MRDHVARRLNKHFNPDRVPRLSDEALEVWKKGDLSFDRIIYYDPPEINPEQAFPYVRQFSQFGTDLKMTRHTVHAFIGHLWAMRLNTFRAEAEPVSAEEFIEVWDRRIRNGKSVYFPKSMNGGLSVAIEKDNSYPALDEPSGRVAENREEVARLEQVVRLSYKGGDQELLVLVRGDLETPHREFTSKGQREKKENMLEALSKAYPGSYFSQGIMYPVGSMEKLLLDTSANAVFFKKDEPIVPVHGKTIAGHFCQCCFF
ncbi:hypothetical protein HYV84_02780 [Candidatus Woesearchaeota archaeon]|nr:hypothetical protein [Candidatus Woesearchaeota archaeon]